MVYPAGNGGRLGDTCALDASANDVHTMVRVKKHSNSFDVFSLGNAKSAYVLA